MKHDSFLFAHSALAKALVLASATLVLTACGGSDDEDPKAPLEAINGSATVDEDLSVSDVVTATNAEGTLEFFVTAFPEHGSLVLNPDGRYSYQPDSNYNGSDSFTFYAKDDRGYSNIADVSLTINPVNDAPSAVNSEFSVYGTDTLTEQLAATDPENDSLVYTIEVGPTQGTATLSATGQLNYRANSLDVTADEIIYSVTDTGGLSARASIAIEVLTASLTAINGSATVDEDLSVSDVVTATNAEGRLEFFVTAFPEHGSLVLNTDGRYSYQPDSNYNGSDSFTFYAKDDRGYSNIADVSLTINPVNDAPSAVNSELSVYGTDTLTEQLAATDPENDSLVYTIEVGPTQGTATLSATGQLNYRANNLDVTADEIIYSVTDTAGLSARASISIEVLTALLTDPIEAINAEFNTDEDVTLNQQVTTTDATGAVEYFVTRHPMHGELTFNLNGEFAYTPAANFHGSDSFSFFARDDRSYSNIADVNVTIAPTNDAPTANNQSGRVYGVETLALQLTGDDLDGDNIQFSLVAQPEHGSASVTAEGVFSYQANSPYNGTDNVQFRVTDEGGLSAIASVNIDASASPIRFEPRISDWTVEKNNVLTGELVIENFSSSNVTLPLVDAPEWLQVPALVSVAANSQQTISFTADSMDLTLGSHSGVITYQTGVESSINFSHVLAIDVTEDLTAPTRISDLSVEAGELYNMATLTWTAPRDNDRDIIAAAQYEMRYATRQITEQTWSSATPVANLPTPLASGSSQQKDVSELAEATTYFFAIRALDAANNISAVSNVASFSTPSAPVAELAPGSIIATLTEGEVGSFELTLSNTGESPMVYSTQVETASAPTAFNTNKTLNKVAMPPITANAVAASSGDIIVKVQPNFGASLAVNAALNAKQLNVTRTVNKLNLQVIETKNKSAQEVADTINALNKMPEVIYAEPDYLVHAIATPDDARYSEQWALNNEGQTGGELDADIDAPEVWDNYTSGHEVVVAVIDTGVKYDHEDLAANIWTNSGEIPGNGIDDDGNGFIDDVHGYDFVNNDGDPMDDNDHGSHCAGIIGADTNNGIGIAGTVHTAKIMGVKFLSAGGSGSTSAAINSVLYAVDNGATILSNSWGGGGFSQALEDAIQYALDNDVLFIAAAGNNSTNNDNSPHYPSNYEVDNVISVASTTHTDGLSSFSNYGAATVHLGAPGSNILSTVSNGGYAVFSGTSMATPYVSGAAVMLRSNFPQLSALEVKEILLETVDPIEALDGRSVTGGRLNVQAAMTEAASRSFISLPQNSSGQVAAGASVVIPVTVNTLDKRAGLYENLIRFYINNPTTPEFTAPVSITINSDGVAPTAVADLTIESIVDTQATLSWTNTGDDGNTGNADEVLLAYATDPITAGNWDDATIISGISAGANGTNQQFVATGLTHGTQYYFAVKLVDTSGEISDLSNVVTEQTLSGARIGLTPETVSPITLAPAGTGAQDIVISNTGDMLLTYSLDVNKTNDDSSRQSLNTKNKSVEFEKGESDNRSGDAVALGSGGPDVFGYAWSDSDEGNVQYDWQDISATGTSMTFSDDNVRGPFQLGFDMPFYDNAYGQVWVSSNGYVSFTQPPHSGCCSGQPIPSADDINNMIAWAWRDLYPRSGYSAHYLAEADKFTIQFTNYGEFGGNGLISAQIILYPNGNIKLQYQSLSDDFDANRTSIGIENADGSDGLQVVFNADYLHNELAVLFTAPLSWVSLSHNSGDLDPNDVETDTVTLNYDASGLADGTYTADLIINHNDPSRESIQIPLQLNVVTPE